jgi:DNA-binding transcriptional MerR regulator
MKNTGNKGLLKIAALSKETGVSVSTIHYYVQQGLLTPPTKTARNMAYYNPACIREIRLIQDLQKQKYFPLSAIKNLLQAERSGQKAAHVAEMNAVFTDIFRLVGTGLQSRSLSLSELLASTGLIESEVLTLESSGLLTPVQSAAGPVYDDIDIQVAQIFKWLAGFSLKPEDLAIYRQYIHFLRREARTLHQAIHRLPNHDDLPVMEWFKKVNDLKGYLALRIYRQEASHSHIERFGE